MRRLWRLAVWLAALSVFPHRSHGRGHPLSNTPTYSIFHTGGYPTLDVFTNAAREPDSGRNHDPAHALPFPGDHLPQPPKTLSMRGRPRITFSDSGRRPPAPQRFQTLLKGVTHLRPVSVRERWTGFDSGLCRLIETLLYHAHGVRFTTHTSPSVTCPTSLDGTQCNTLRIISAGAVE